MSGAETTQEGRAPREACNGASPPAVGFSGVRFTYGGSGFALDGVDLNIAPGEFVCLLGGNGSGKSTLAKHANALLLPDEGSVRVLGASTADADALRFIRSSVGMVFQSPDDQIVASVVEDDVAFGPENLGIPEPELEVRVREALEEVGLQGFGSHETSALSGGQKQRVAIAGALAMRPQVLVLDEAGAMLDPRGRAGLLKACRRLNDAGMAILLITHFMDEAVLADRVVVLEDGKVAMEGTPSQVLADARRLKELSLDSPFAVDLSLALRDVGVDVPVCVDELDLVREVSDRLPGGRAKGRGAKREAVRDSTPPGQASGLRSGGRDSVQSSVAGNGPARRQVCIGKPDAAPLLEMRNVSYSYMSKGARRRIARKAVKERAPLGEASPQASSGVGSSEGWGGSPDSVWAVEGVSMAVREGEVLGLAGHTGSGKSTLVQLAAGLLRPSEGAVMLRGRDLANRRNLAEARGEVGVVFQYPEKQLFAQTVFDDIAFGPRNLGLDEAEVNLRAADAAEAMGIDLGRIGARSPFELSGGQQRRCAIAGVLAMKPRLLILDEPAAGLDPKSHDALMALVRALRDGLGMTIVLVSHNMNDIAALCDRLVVLNRGALFAEGTPLDVFSDERAARAVGLDVPDALRIARRLGLNGLNGLNAVPTVEQLARMIAEEARL